MFVFHILLGVVLLSVESHSSNYVEEYFDQTLDHFNFEIKNNTFKQRVLYNDTWWDRGRGPIFFYAGNEGDVTGYWQNSGFIFQIAQQLGAFVIFAEHRYYGKSHPFGEDSFRPETIGFLSVQQVVADYAFLLKYYKEKFNAEKCPIIAFGGSYGGILAAYMRYKYPNIISGAIAASAPIYLVAGKLPGNIFFQGVTKAFREEGCEKQVRLAFAQIQKWASEGTSGLQEISRTFHLCQPLVDKTDYDHFLRWIRNAFVVAALMNYPYPAEYLGKFPAFPVRVMCSRLLNSSRPADGLYDATTLYYNASDSSMKCFDIYKEYFYCADPTGCFGSETDSKAWDYQACTEINMEADTNGVTDMFPILPFNNTMTDKYCLQTWKVLPRRDWLDVLFWGQDISSTSNIVFSNGNLDPCAGGGVLSNISDSIVSVLIDGAAHHLDLRGDNPMDPPSVRFARDFEKRNIQNWLQEYYMKNFNY